MKTYRTNLLTLTLCLTVGVCLAEMSVNVDDKTQRYTIQDNGKPVLTYNFGTMPVPEGVGGKYAVARSDYVHPLFGPDGKEPIGIFLLQNPSNPLYPGDWVEYANLPWLQPTFPSAGMAYELKQGEPLKLAFRVIVRSGDGLKVTPEKLFADYIGNMPDPLLKMASYKFGENREVLTGAELAFRNAAVEDRPAIEQRILNLLNAQKTSAGFQCWAFYQLQIYGSEKCLPVAAAIT